uniref:Uncharacterized protein n=1 Tax=Avena sativa TaxID=4498 RepID=A0ACD5XYP0_AVESA
MLGAFEEDREADSSLLKHFSGYVRISAALLPWAAIGLFHKSHRDAYNDNDVKVTYALFCCTAVLEYASRIPSVVLFKQLGKSRSGVDGRRVRAKGKAVQWQWVQKIVALYEQAKEKVMQWQWVKKKVALHERIETKVTQRLQTVECIQQWVRRMDALALNTGKLIDAIRHSRVGQYNLVGFFVRNKMHTKTTCILSSFNHKEFLYQQWSMKPCNSSFVIIELVHKYVQKGWEDQIKDAESYWEFNDRRGQWTLESNRCDQGLICGLRTPFDESVLLWHIATDFCFYYMDDASAERRCATAKCIQDASGVGHGCAVWCGNSPRHKRAVRCREISNYMIYLLFVKPEMLLSGTRRNLLMTANAELEKILSDDNPMLKNILKGDKPSLMEILKRNKPFLNFFTGKRPLLKEIERGFVQRIITKVQHTENREQVGEHAGSPPDAHRYYATTREGFVPDAWNLAKALLDIGDENRMWEVIEGVWVEMLCFSASRCRGYLHAKSLGTGGELLTYVLLLLSHMGMETSPERLQRSELSSGEGNAGAPPSTSQILHEMEHPTRFRRSWSL